MELDRYYEAQKNLAPVGTYPETKKADVIKAAAQVMIDAVLDAVDAATYKGSTAEKATVEQIVKENLEAAKAVIGNMETKEELAADKAAVEAAIDAIPSPVTVADKELVKAAKDALEAYADTPGADVSDISATKRNQLEKAAAVIQAAEKKAVQEQVDALNKKGDKVTSADKAALEEAKAAVEAYEKEYEDDPLGLDATLDTIEQKIEKAQFNEAADAIKAIPENVTAADKATVEAAREAFDALTDAQKDQMAKSLKDKLAAAEEAIAAEEKADEDAEAAFIASVESLKIKASSTVGKGYIKVKWTVTGDDSNVEGWEIWKSSKKSSGFKKAYTQVASKHTYKNTKGLKKGTRYYYKVRAIAYAEDGTKIKSDWSNKAYRVAK